MTDATPPAGPTPAASSHPPAAPGAGRPQPLGGAYWRLWGSSTVSNLGDGVALVAFPWLASTLTRDPFLIAALTFATRLPWLLFSLHAGAIVDRGDRRRILLAMNSLRCAVAALVGLAVALDAMSLALLYAAALVLGFTEVLFDNASQALLPRVVPVAELERANGRLWGAQLVMNDFVGKPAGGALIAVGLAAPFLFDAATALVSVLLLLALRGSFRSRAPRLPGAARTPLRADIGEGLRWLWRHRLLRVLALMLGTMNASDAAATATFVLFARELLGLGSTGFGLLLAAGAVGGVLGSQLAAPLASRLGPGPALACSVAVLMTSLAVTGLSSSALVIAAVTAAAGFFVMVWNVLTVSLRQAIIPDELLGRVNSAYRFFGWGMIPLGTLLGGAMVAGVDLVASREVALRAPFLAAAALHALLLVVARRHLRSAQLIAARAGRGR